MGAQRVKGEEDYPYQGWYFCGPGKSFNCAGMACSQGSFQDRMLKQSNT